MASNNELALIAAKMRLRALKAALKAKKGHVPPAFSCMDVVVSLFEDGLLNVNPDEPKAPTRDRFILSKGHACLALYTIMSHRGFFGDEELDDFAGHGSFLPGHPDLEIPGVEAISGSLGHGLGLGSGMALAARMNGEDWKTTVILGDGECQEGSIWEAAMFAGQQKLSNLTAIVDYNKLGATNFTDNVISLEPFADRWTSFGWNCVEIDGHDYNAIRKAYTQGRDERPRAIIAHTTKGKGVDFMENSPKWHHALPQGEQVEEALAQLQGQIDALSDMSE
ncbi:putative transketolase N-terminal section [Candidatus Terasakiella magnetica]|uniref:Putative transketolase N-terminal section n=1 Tax=Candidatus Terasakiella magnetica TaxID=1867952 RepID=A0A1C3RKQ7_9PROT|nr:transketolase [Candidatus Terasakiella magnetica]SCA57843.1 putative transketolase N-terminal section [Candidatus Terasakiella magnetica]